MGLFFDLHRHDEFSFFDGFGKASELAEHAKELDYCCLGLSNHGNMSGLVRHWKACRENEIKPILGCEVYFQPIFNRKNPKRESYHLCLFAKNYEGYKNLCKILTAANEEQFYYKPIVDFKLLEKYNEGLICTTACVSGYLSKAVLAEAYGMAKKALYRFDDIFGDDLYIEIQPYTIDDEGTQEFINVSLMKLASDNNVKCILTSDSHYSKKSDFDTYCKLHQIAGHSLEWVENTYSTRYMPSEAEIIDRFVEMHEQDIENVYDCANEMLGNLKILSDSVENDILGQCVLSMPKLENVSNSHKALVQLVKNGLRKKEKYNKDYVERCKEELDVIKHHGFEDYFLMVQEYVNWAKKQSIEVGDGRGSACNCLVSYAIGITNVDSIKYNLAFSRFMRKEKKKLPDIDVDFETPRRGEVIEHVVNTYEGKSVRICSYSEYGVKNLIDDLSKVCGLVTTVDVDEEEARENKKTILDIKAYIQRYQDGENIDFKRLVKDSLFHEYNSQYDNIIKHFVKMYKKVRNLGTHAAGVAVVGTDILNYTCVVRRGSGKNMYYSSCYDLNDLETINCLKFDMLGLGTLSELKGLRQLSNYDMCEDDFEDRKIYEYFREGKTDGIFQMERGTPKKILEMIHCDSMDDVIAVNALNRPAPLQLKMHETFAHNKLSGNVETNTPYYKYTKETYGTMLYQEQTTEVAQKLGHLTSEQSFDLLKIMKKPANLVKPENIPVIEKMKKDFFRGCKSEGMTEEQTKSIWSSMLIYGFNKGHSTGYSLISVRQMFYKVYYPAIFWYVKMRYARNDHDLYNFTRCAIKDGIVVMLPHVNFTDETDILKKDGDYMIRQGLVTVKGVGKKAAQAIHDELKENGEFLNYDDFVERCKSQAVNARVIKALGDCGALEFNEKKYVSRVIKYNSTMLVRR